MERNNKSGTYSMVQKDSIQIHFFEFKELDPKENYGQVYIRTDKIEELYQLALDKKIEIQEAGHLQIKPWQQKEFSLLDPDNNLLTLDSCFTFDSGILLVIPDTERLKRLVRLIF